MKNVGDSSAGGSFIQPGNDTGVNEGQKLAPVALKPKLAEGDSIKKAEKLPPGAQAGDVKRSDKPVLPQAPNVNANSATLQLANQVLTNATRVFTAMETIINSALKDSTEAVSKLPVPEELKKPTSKEEMPTAEKSRSAEGKQPPSRNTEGHETIHKRETAETASHESGVKEGMPLPKILTKTKQEAPQQQQKSEAQKQGANIAEQGKVFVQKEAAKGAQQAEGKKADESQVSTKKEFEGKTSLKNEYDPNGILLTKGHQESEVDPKGILLTKGHQESGEVDPEGILLTQGQQQDAESQGALGKGLQQPEESTSENFQKETILGGEHKESSPLLAGKQSKASDLGKTAEHEAKAGDMPSSIKEKATTGSPVSRMPEHTTGEKGEPSAPKAEGFVPPGTSQGTSKDMQKLLHQQTAGYKGQQAEEMHKLGADALGVTSLQDHPLLGSSSKTKDKGKVESKGSSEKKEEGESVKTSSPLLGGASSKGKSATKGSSGGTDSASEKTSKESTDSASDSGGTSDDDLLKDWFPNQGWVQGMKELQGIKVTSSDPATAWFAAKCFIVEFAINAMLLSRVLSEMTAVQAKAAILMRAQERDQVNAEAAAIIERGEQEAQKLDMEAQQKIITAVIGLAFTAMSFAAGAAVGGKNYGTDYKQVTNSIDGIKNLTTTLIEAGYTLKQKDYVRNMAYQDALRTLAKDKYDTIVAARRNAMDYLAKLRDTLNEVLSGLQKLLEEAYRVGQFTRS